MICYYPKYQSLHNEAEKGYSAAMSYYKVQKDNFLKYLSNQVNTKTLTTKMATTFIDNLNKEMEIQTNNLGASKELKENLDKLEQKIISSVQSNGSKTKEYSLIKRMGSSGSYTIDASKEEVLKFINKYKEQFNKLLEKINIQQLISESLNQEFNSLQGAEKDQLYGFARRIVTNQMFKKTLDKTVLLGQKNMSGYLNALQGLFKEDIIVAALTELLGENSAVGVGDTTVNGYQTSTDILINFGQGNVANSLNNIEKINEVLAGVMKNAVPGELGDMVSELLNNKSSGKKTKTNYMYVDLFDPNNFIGAAIQSKSWIDPKRFSDVHTDLKKLRPYFTIGDRAKYYRYATPRGADGVTAWHYNIYALSKQVISLLGAATLLYSTRDGIVWTDDLIKTFRQHNYYLSYYFKRSGGFFTRPATTEVTWQQEVPFDKFKGFK